MSKTVQEVLAKIKGTGRETETLTNKASFSSSAWGDLVHAMANDPNYKFSSVGKNGAKVETSINALLVADAKKTSDNAKWPQKSEAAVLEKVEISTKGLQEVIPKVVTEFLRTGKKFPIAQQPDFMGDIYLAAIPGKTRTVNVRDIKTKTDIGTTTTITKDWVQIRAKSPTPKDRVTKIRKDVDGKVIN